MLGSLLYAKLPLCVCDCMIADVIAHFPCIGCVGAGLDASCVILAIQSYAALPVDAKIGFTDSLAAAVPSSSGVATRQVGKVADCGAVTWFTVGLRT